MKLSDLIKTVEIKIPDTDLVITLKTELSWFEQLESREIKGTLEKGKYLTCALLVDWNLEDDEGIPIPITKETIERLPADVLMPITKKITSIANERLEKKKN